ncbi:PTS sugar transporter subunit IIA [Pontiella sulfatireligans]|uniref:Nitrogen regulatory protein n=1 Tax=Pontiella sulfatireligans TaxID=2750658 RepID=A0A6C2UNJ3_9BACT|nr:PTS sugar transporter subunit IIA [Pontiella sulfatireligans]VGO20616.1 Nitrogen regulatory protein [Pontiella sulfatireligans]
MQLSVKDVAKLLSVDNKTIYGWIKQGDIPVYHINEHCRFNKAEILEWATSRQIAHIAHDASDMAHFPGLVEALGTGGIVYGVKGENKPTVLRNVVDAMQLPAEVDRDFFYEVLLARENLGSTGLGDGIAIPHVRNPVVLHVTRPTITLCFLETPIEFGSIDGQPVDILFSMVSPTVHMHLHLLARLGFVLRNPEFKAALKARLPQDKLIEALALAEAEIGAGIQSSS